MKYAAERIAEVHDLVTLRGERNIYGDVIRVTLTCGHTSYLNATMSHRAGNPVKCFECVEPGAVKVHVLNHRELAAAKAARERMNNMSGSWMSAVVLPAPTSLAAYRC